MTGFTTFCTSGSHPLVVVLDCSKAFDLCKFDKLFSLLLQKGLPPIIIRTFMHMYEEQCAWVRWGNARSVRFPIVNGTRQGSIASPTFWSVYMDPLLKKLRRLGVGCHVGNVFLGVMAYADDLVLVAPNRAAAVQMLGVCEAWAEDCNVHFSTDMDPSKSKSKVIFMCGQRKDLSKPAPVTLCGRPLPYVQSATHLGHELHESGNMEFDTRVKRTQFISNSFEVREVFSFASPPEVLGALKTYTCSFYGSNLWDLGGVMACQVYNSWWTSMKLAWEVPRATRRYLAQQVLSCGLSSVRVDILSKFVGFFQSLRDSPCPEVSFLASLVGRDIRSITGKNLRLVARESSLNPWVVTPSTIKKVFKEKEENILVPPDDHWRLSYLDLLLEQRQNAH